MGYLYNLVGYLWDIQLVKGKRRKRNPKLEHQLFDLRQAEVISLGIVESLSTEGLWLEPKNCGWNQKNCG